VTRVVLIRHGESACNMAGVVGGHGGCTGLTPIGRRQAEQLRDRLAKTAELESAVALYTSRLARAIETAQVIAQVVGGGSQQVISSCSLCELHPGAADGLTWEECRNSYGEPDWEHDPAAVVSPGGETWAGFVERASSAVQGLADSHQGGLVVAVCHGGVIEATMLSFLPIPNRNKPFDLPTTYTSITEWERRRSDWRLVRYNDVAHLGGPYEAQRSGPHEALRGNEPAGSQA
jgi:2,3-bisphosphoglycerate-dependent phosphoglycerate mutase